MNRLLKILHKEALTNKVRILDYQVQVFYAWRRSRGITADFDIHSQWITYFCKWWPKNDILELNKQDMDDFLQHVGMVFEGEYPIQQAEKAICSLVRFYKARGSNMYH